MHTLLDLRGAIPAFIHISNGKMADVNVLYILIIEAEAFYVMDRGYLDFARLHKLHPPFWTIFLSFCDEDQVQARFNGVNSEFGI